MGFSLARAEVAGCVCAGSGSSLWRSPSSPARLLSDLRRRNPNRSGSPGRARSSPCSKTWPKTTGRRPASGWKRGAAEPRKACVCYARAPSMWPRSAALQPGPRPPSSPMLLSGWTGWRWWSTGTIPCGTCPATNSGHSSPAGETGGRATGPAPTRSSWSRGTPGGPPSTTLLPFCGRTRNRGARTENFHPEAWAAEANLDVLLWVGGLPSGIGFVSAGEAARLAGKGMPVAAVSIDGNSPSRENFLNGSYPLVRHLTLLFAEDNENARQLADLALSEKGAETLRSYGFFPPDRNP